MVLREFKKIKKIEKNSLSHLPDFLQKHPRGLSSLCPLFPLDKK